MAQLLCGSSQGVLSQKQLLQQECLTHFPSSWKSDENSFTALNRVGNKISEPSSRGQVCECESVCVCAEGTQAIALQPTLKLGECPGAPSQRAPRN